MINLDNEYTWNWKNGWFIVDIKPDAHIGRKGHERAAWLKALKQPYPSIFPGDLLECINPVDPRYCKGEHGKYSILNAYHQLLVDLEPHEKKIIGIGKGNHEDHWFRAQGNAYQDNVIFTDENGVDHIAIAGLCPTLKTRYLGSIAYLVFTKNRGRKVSRWQIGHPSKGKIEYKSGEEARKSTNEKIKAKTIQSHLSDADIYISGHFHIGVIMPPQFTTRRRFVWDKRKKKLLPKYVCTDHRWYCTCPSFVRNYKDMEDCGYEEAWQLSLSDTGWLRVWMDENLVIRKVRIISVDDDMEISESLGPDPEKLEFMPGN